MKKAIVYSSVTGNTKKLAHTIHEEIGEVEYCGKISEDALKADMIFVGFWTQGFSCSKDVSDFLAKVKDKKVFIFGTAGYGNTEEFFAPIMDSVKSLLCDSNQIVGTYICQGKVSDAKQKAIKDMDEDKFNVMKPMLDESVSHPNDADIANLKEVIKSL